MNSLFVYGFFKDMMFLLYTPRHLPLLTNFVETKPCNMSFFHLFPVEYAFGGHPNNWSGIFEMSPKSVEVLGGDFKFRLVL